MLPTDVDYRVMCTFLEFYQTLLQFVNFKLYHSVGAAYPPVVDPRMEEAAEGLAAIMEELAQPPQNPPTSTPLLPLQFSPPSSLCPLWAGLSMVAASFPFVLFH